MEGNALFGNLKIVELSEGISASFCTKLFADLGAEVIKVEPPIGDVARRRPPFLNDEPGLERSGLFAFLNTNKLGVTLDVNKRQGYDILTQLLRDANVMVENNPPQTMAASGLDYEHLQAISPTLIVTSITPFGQDGPWRDYSGNGFIVSHTSGFAYENGHAEADLEAHPPLAIPCSMAEFLGGLTAASATMCALFGQSPGERGTHVDVALQEALASFLRLAVSEITYGGHVPGRKTSDLLKVLIGQHPTADGYVDFVIRIEKMWQSLMAVMGNPEWNNNQLYASMENRSKYASAVWSHVREETPRFEKQELAEASQARGIPAAPVNTVADVARDGHFRDRSWFGEFDHPVIGRVRYPGPPVKIGDFCPSGEGRHPAPLLGQDNREVYGKRLGYSDAELASLHEAGVI